MNTRKHKQWNSFQALIYLSLLSFILASCSGEEIQQQVGANLSQGSAQFQGAHKLTPRDDGKWTLSWIPILGADGKLQYNIYMKKDGEAYDFSQPVDTTEQNFFITPDLRLSGNTCFVVRFAQIGLNTFDPNLNEICTNTEAYEFPGIEKINSLADGTYMLRWSLPKHFKNAKFRVFSRKAKESNWTSLGLTEDGFFNTAKIDLNDATCFRVRHEIAGFPLDNNEVTRCTNEDGDGNNVGNLTFNGVKKLSSPEAGSLLIEWDPATFKDLAGYHIYFGSDFKKENRIFSVEDPQALSYVKTELLHAVVYTVGVRAYDKYGREDNNTNIISFELKNSHADITQVSLRATKTDEWGRPIEVECSAVYVDEEKWQTLTPEFYIKNNKRNNLGLVDRMQVIEKKDTTAITYTLQVDDQRDDELICGVRVFDGFDYSKDQVTGKDWVESTPLKIPDTPVVATGFELAVLENSEIRVDLSAGEGIGYTDRDKDIAVNINYRVENGYMVASQEEKNNNITPEFTCVEGTCSGTFKAVEGFYTDYLQDNPVFMKVIYQVEAGSSLSNWGEVVITVLPRPRALTLDLEATQNSSETYVFAAEEIRSGDTVTAHASLTSRIPRNLLYLYTYPPQSEARANGLITIPTDVSLEGHEDAGCTLKNVAGYNTKQGQYCKIPCVNNECRFEFNADQDYYGPSYFDYAIEVEGIEDKGVKIESVMSSPATAEIDVRTLLRASGFQGLTVEGEEYKIIFQEGQGFMGTEGPIEVTSISVLSDSVGNETPIVFYGPFGDSANPRYEATFEPTDSIKSNEYFGTFRYEVYAVNTERNDGVVLRSNIGEAKILFFPKPVATGVNDAVLLTDGSETGTELDGQEVFISKGDGLGYTHFREANASVIDIYNVDSSRGEIVGFSGATSGQISCVGGSCSVPFLSALGVWDSSAATYPKFDYRVRVAVDSTLLADPTWIIDDYLSDPNNQVLYSDIVTANVNVRPRPIAQNLTRYVAEAVALKPTNLSVLLELGDPNGNLKDYYSLDSAITRAASAQLLAAPATTQGTAINFSCFDGGNCSGDFVPAIGYTSWVNLNYTVSVTDTLFTRNGVLKNNGLITSRPKTLDIEVRPVPKATDITIFAGENTDFARTAAALSLQRTTDINNEIGYYHPTENAVAAEIKLNDTDITNRICASTSESINDSLWTNCSEAAVSCAAGTCSVNYYPVNGTAPLLAASSLALKYNVTINDPQLGLLKSVDGNMAINVKRRPRVFQVGLAGYIANPGQQVSAVENEDLSFEIRPGPFTQTLNPIAQYTHADGLLASRFSLSVDAAKGRLTPASGGNCLGSGVCQFSFHNNPDTYQGDVPVTYSVEVDDPDLGIPLESNQAEIHIDAYPWPRATGRVFPVRIQSIGEIKIEQRPYQGSSDDPDVIFDEAGYDDALKLGYRHRRDDIATAVTINPGSLGLGEGQFNDSAFVCSSGVCTISYTAPSYDPADRYKDFEYKMTVNGVTSQQWGTLTLDVRPVAVTKDIQEVTLANEPVEIEIDFNTDYTHPLYDSDNPSVNIENYLSRYVVVSSDAPVHSHDSDLPLSLDIEAADSIRDCGSPSAAAGVQGRCVIRFTPELDFTTNANNNNSLASFKYHLRNWDSDLNTLHDSINDSGGEESTIFINVRPKPVTNDKTFWIVQGTSPTIQLKSNAHAYQYENGTIDHVDQLVITESTNAESPVSVAGTYSCNPQSTDNPAGNGICLVNFEPEETYYGSAADFTFHVEVDDAPYRAKHNANIASNSSTITFDVRPLPVATGQDVHVWQGQSRTIRFEKGASAVDKKGWFHLGDPYGYLVERVQVNTAPLVGASSGIHGLAS